MAVDPGTVKVVEIPERSCIEPQLRSAAKFKVIARPVTYEEIMLPA